jgi:hypothetical protein
MPSGGKRPNTGPKKGKKYGMRASTIQRLLTKEQGRDALRALVLERLRPMVEAQLANALGVRHTFLRDDSGRFVQLTDPKQIERALNSGDEGKYYWTFTKDPSIQAFTDLMNRALDKPAEQTPPPQQTVQVNVSVKVAKLAAVLEPQQLQLIRERINLGNSNGLGSIGNTLDSRGNRSGNPVSSGT